MRAKAFVAVHRSGLCHGRIDGTDDALRVASGVVATQQVTAQTVLHKGLCRPKHLRFGTPEAVNTLLRVAHDEDAGRLPGTGVAAQPSQQCLPLQRIGVLKFVDQKMTNACIQFFLHPARQHRVTQHDQCGAFDVVHVDPAAFALEVCELGHQQARQARHALLVGPGVVLMPGCGHGQHKFLRLAHGADAHNFFAKFTGFAFGRQQGQINGASVASGQGAL